MNDFYWAVAKLGGPIAMLRLVAKTKNNDHESNTLFFYKSQGE